MKGKIAVVTGASSGIGRAIAVTLAGEGADVLLLGRRIGKLRAVASICPSESSSERCYQVDLLSSVQIRRIGQQVLKEWGKVDYLIHSAGIIKLNSFQKARVEDFDLQYRCNVRAPFALTRVLLPGLIKGRGQIVFINSTAGLTASSGTSQYSATKHALKAVADSIREELNPLGVRVVSFYLGRTATPMQAQVHKAERKPYHPESLIQPEQVSAAVLQTLQMGREAEIMDVRIRPFQEPEQAKKARYALSYTR